MNISLEVALANGLPAAGQAQDFHNLSPWNRALRRMPALLLTLIIELFVAFIVSEYADCDFKLLRVTSVLPPGDRQKWGRYKIEEYDNMSTAISHNSKCWDKLQTGMLDGYYTRLRTFWSPAAVVALYSSSCPSLILTMDA